MLRSYHKAVFGTSFLVVLTILSFLYLTSSTALADTSTVSTASVTVSETCMMTGTLDTPHTAKLVNGTYSGLDYNNGIGQTTLKVFCNDGAGFAIYAIGYTNDEYGNNYLHWNKATSVSDHTEDIATGIYNSNSTVNSTWSMKLAAISGTYAATIDDGVQAHNDSTEDYTNWHEVPDEYQRVAYRTSGTDVEVSGVGIGSSITVTYDSYISGTQPVGTYLGQVKYVLIHPSAAPEPIPPLNPSLCPANSVCYAPNASDIIGSMSSLPQTTTAITNALPQAGAISATANSTTELIAPNYKREGYGFAGWSTEFDATTATNPTIYGPNETISTNPNNNGVDISGGLILYPVWIAKETNITMQTFNSDSYPAYSSAPNGTVIALEDERDHDIYAVAKLADGKWWMIENLRLDDSATLTIENTHNPLHNINNVVTLKTNYANNTVDNHLAASNSGTWCTSNSSACDDQTMLNTNNTRITDTSLTASYNGTNATSKWYGYGNYYNWYSATAGHGIYNFVANGNSTDGDICPAGWYLPTGGNIYKISSSVFWALSMAIVGEEPANTSSSTIPKYMGDTEGTNASRAFRAYPNNFVYNGGWNGDQATDRGSYGFYWASYSDDNTNAAFDLFFDSSSLNPGTNSNRKYRGYSVRCVAGS